MGILFQIVDDVLDATATSHVLGKTTGKDLKSGKSTYVSLIGIEKARQAANEWAQRLKSEATLWSPQPGADAAAELIDFFTQRTH